jgi:hypothetical protein
LSEDPKALELIEFVTEKDEFFAYLGKEEKQLY